MYVGAFLRSRPRVPRHASDRSPKVLESLALGTHESKTVSLLPVEGTSLVATSCPRAKSCWRCEILQGWRRRTGIPSPVAHSATALLGDGLQEGVPSPALVSCPRTPGSGRPPPQPCTRQGFRCSPGVSPGFSSGEPLPLSGPSGPRRPARSWSRFRRRRRSRAPQAEPTGRRWVSGTRRLASSSVCRR